MTTPETTTEAQAAPPFMRTIKTYVLRAGRMGSGQVRAFEQFGPQFLVPYSAERLDVQAAFGRTAPLILEIGFGMGDATAKIAQVRQGDNFLCCDIRIVQHDAVEVMDHMLGTDSLDGVHIFFPDPWHKSRHHKRRLIQSPFVQRLAQHIKPGGYLHLATDWQPYAEQMLAVVSAEPLLVNTADAAQGGYAIKPDYRPLTKFENRGLKLGHGVWDLVFRRV
jgi:tRNA (guanine-N7-)-methyltransferase